MSVFFKEVFNVILKFESRWGYNVVKLVIICNNLELIMYYFNIYFDLIVICLIKYIYII